jgi:peptide/nickel transport system substrate-binding protein
VLFAASLARTGPVTADPRPLHLGLIQQPNSLDPLHATEFYENYLSEAIFSGLTVIDDRGQASADLAEMVPTRANGGISADGTTIVYHLRAGVRWQDGAPLTSRDVAFTFARMQDPQTNFPETSVYAIVRAVETPDARTVVLRLRRPWADATVELFVGGQNGSILPEHVLGRADAAAAARFESAPIGSGPYRVERWDRGDRIVLRANAGYFRGKPAIDRIDVEFVPDTTTMGIRVRTGELDFSPQISPAFVEIARTIPRLQVRSAPTYTDVELVFNVHAAPVDDARVRRALGLAIDRQRLVTTVYHGFAVVGDDLVPPQSPFHTRDASLAPHGDQARAAALLDAAGWRLESDGMRHKGGAALSIPLTINAGYVLIAADAVQLQAMWHAIGVDAPLRPQMANVLLDTTGPLARGDYVATLAGDGYAVSPDRADTLTGPGLPPGGRNYAHYANRDVDAWTAAARTTLDASARATLYGKISERIRDDAPLIPLLWTLAPYVYDGALEGLRPEPVNSDMWNVYAWHWH